MYNEKNCCSKFELTATLKPVVFNEYFQLEYLKITTYFNGGNIHNGETN